MPFSRRHLKRSLGKTRGRRQTCIKPPTYPIATPHMRGGARRRKKGRTARRRPRKMVPMAQQPQPQPQPQPMAQPQPAGPTFGQNVGQGLGLGVGFGVGDALGQGAVDAVGSFFD